MVTRYNSVYSQILASERLLATSRDRTSFSARPRIGLVSFSKQSLSCGMNAFSRLVTVSNTVIENFAEQIQT